MADYAYKEIKNALTGIDGINESDIDIDVKDDTANVDFYNVDKENFPESDVLGALEMLAEEIFDNGFDTKRGLSIYYVDFYLSEDLLEDEDSGKSLKSSHYKSDDEDDTPVDFDTVYETVHRVKQQILSQYLEEDAECEVSMDWPDSEICDFIFENVSVDWFPKTEIVKHLGRNIADTKENIDVNWNDDTTCVISFYWKPEWIVESEPSDFYSDLE